MRSRTVRAFCFVRRQRRCGNDPHCQTRKDINYVAAFPKSGITYLNYMLFHALFDADGDVTRIDSDYIVDIHEFLGRVPSRGRTDRYVKTHYSFSQQIPLRRRARRALYLVRDPIDVMMSSWDYKHLTGEGGLLDANDNEEAALFADYRRRWLETGGDAFLFAGTWTENVRSWLNQAQVPTLVVSYEALRANPRQELERVLAFLGLELAPERVEGAVAAGRVENMRKQETREAESGVSGAFFRPSLQEGYERGYRFVGRLNERS